MIMITFSSSKYCLVLIIRDHKKLMFANICKNLYHSLNIAELWTNWPYGVKSVGNEIKSGE